MKKTVSFIMAIFLVQNLFAQVQVKDLPQEGFDQRIRAYINNMHVVDTHEHLANPEGLKKSGMLDFTLLLHHYADDDIKSAGISKSDFAETLTNSMSVMEKWQAIKPYWEGSFNTGYNRAVQLTADKLFGVKNIDVNTVEDLSANIRKAYESDWFNEVLKEKCKIDYAVIDGNDRSFGDQDMLRYIKRFDYININSKHKIENIAKRAGAQMNTFDNLLTSLNNEFINALQEGIVAVKIGVAYSRILFFDEVKKEEAEEIFNKIVASKSKEALPFEEVKALQDYLTHRVVELADEAAIPVQIHTGLQAGDGNFIENSNPTHLANLFLKFRNVNFILFHGGYPFGSELASLAKNFRNVSIDLCWLYIISPSYSERYLNEWLETVPANKIMAFGGDFHNVEGVYGHLLFARQVVANVLIKKVRDGYFSEAEALKVAQMILHDNAISILKLDKRN
ncbi:amidohydrolase family protein [Prolixibacteraceae bacterium Z1-6]|uniref:Amidohydrolase family protein n=1 Tax=Draconibacterium aestuarii TaxID=2998507 RepID=A0A9X3F9S8_9BACT|nr:amidohydrolase family protein [Prolixibacteraceae bacterium Z1-6]